MKDNQLVNNKGTFIKYRGLVYKKDTLTGNIRLLIPKYIASDILSRLHMKNHCGLTALVNNFENLFYCPNGPNLAKNVLKKCLTCVLSPRGHLMKTKELVGLLPLPLVLIESYLPIPRTCPNRKTGTRF